MKLKKGGKFFKFKSGKLKSRSPLHALDVGASWTISTPNVDSNFNVLGVIDKNRKNKSTDMFEVEVFGNTGKKGDYDLIDNMEKFYSEYSDVSDDKVPFWARKRMENYYANDKNFHNWYRQYSDSGIWFKGSGKDQSFDRLGFKDLEGPSVYKKGVFNTDHEWLLESWANATDDEISDYLARLGNEGYSKLDLAFIKDTLLEDRSGAKGALIDKFVKKTGVSKDNIMKIVNIDGDEFGLLGGGVWRGKNLSMSGINIKTGEILDIGSKILNENMSLDEQYEFIKNFKSAPTKTVDEVQESIKNYKANNTVDQTFGDTPEETIDNMNKETMNNNNEIDQKTIDDYNKKWMEDKQKEFEKREQEIKDEFSDVNNLDPEEVNKPDYEPPKDTSNTYTDDIKKKLKEIDSWSDDYIKGLSEEDIINYSDNGEVFEKLYNRWNEVNSSTNTNTNSGDNKQTKQNKQKTKNVFDDYTDWKNAEESLNYTNPENYYYTGNFKFDTDPKTGIPNAEQYKKHTRNLEEIGYDIPEIKGLDADGKPIKGDTRRVRPDVDIPDGVPRKTGIGKYLDDFKNMPFLEKVMTLGNVAGAVSDYKNARREGHGVVSSAVRAGAEFALGEALGLYYPLYLLAKEAPGLVIQGTEMLYKENRKMNSAANQQVFGGAQFQDTQQLATMRQSGMEMAKMAQYNLQQTLMGQEATYLHR